MTAFYRDTIGFEVAKLWEEVSGGPAEQQTTMPKLGVSQWVGPTEGGQLALGVSPGRLDWVFGSADPTVPGSDGGIGPLPDAVKTFQVLMAKWVPKSTAAARLAFGAVTMHGVESREAGYRLLDRYLPDLKLDPEGSRDLLFQINRPRPSQVVKDLLINRLCKWSVASFQRLSVTTGSAPTTTHERFAARLETDFSTAHDNTSDIPTSQIIALFNELVGLVVETAARGDIR